MPISGVTTCNPAGTAFTIGQIIASVDAGMFHHMMGNDPRPHYFHQTNLMSQTTGPATSVGDGLYYETMNPLLTQYNKYFAANAPIVQLTMGQIGTLLTEQAGWAANSGKVTGSIQGNAVTVSNGTGGQLEIPLTGTTVGTRVRGQPVGLGAGAGGNEHVHRARRVARAAGDPADDHAADRPAAGDPRQAARDRADKAAGQADASRSSRSSPSRSPA